jgi:phosphotransferase system HPr (HPr) family protein
VKLAGTFRSEIMVRKDDLEVNGKSIMGMMMLAAEFGSRVTIRASGADAPAAVECLAGLMRAVRRGMMTHRDGIPASPGIVIGRPSCCGWELPRVPHVTVPQASVDARSSGSTMRAAGRRTGSADPAGDVERLGHVEAQIFEPQILMLDDIDLVEGTVAYIRDNHLSAARAFELRMLEYAVGVVAQRASDDHGSAERPGRHPAARHPPAARSGRPDVTWARIEATGHPRARDLTPSSPCSWTATASSGSPRTPARGRRIPRSSRGRSACRPSSAWATCPVRAHRAGAGSGRP